MHSRRWVFLAAATVVTLSGIVLVSRIVGVGRPRPATPVGEVVVATDEQPAEPATSEQASEPRHERDDEHDDDRAATQQAAVRGVVRDASGTPVESAQVDWTGMRAEWIPGDRGWDRIDWKRIEESTQKTLTSEIGEFAFTVERDEPDSVVWVTRASYAVGWALVHAADGPTSVEIRLEQHAPMRIRVVDARDNPVSGAEIVDFGTRPTAEMAAFPIGAIACRTYRADARTDAAGRANLHCFPGRHVVFATANGVTGRPWYGASAPEEEVVLRLDPSMTVDGRVSVIDGFTPTGPMVVSVYVKDANGQGYLLRDLEIQGAGPFGPLQLPVCEGESYELELSGGGAVNQSVDVLVPVAGERRDVVLEARSSSDVEVYVHAESGGPISGARVRVLWYVDPARGDAVEGKTDEHGRARIAGVRAGTCWVSAEAPGWVKNMLANLELPVADGKAVEISLVKGGRVRGRVVSGSGPLSDFGIVSWVSPGKSVRESKFDGRQDGTFELADVPLGDLRLVAFTHAGAQSRTYDVVSSESGGDAVEIVIDPSGSLAGRIVNAVTGEPVAGAVVHRYLDTPAAGNHEPGKEQRTAADGEFEFECAGPGTVYLAIVAEVLATRDLRQTVRSQERLEIGNIPMEPTQPLTVQLYPIQDLDPTEYSVEVRWPAGIPIGHFDGQGRCVYDAAPPGSWTIEVVHPDWSSTAVVFDLRAGSDWIVEVPIGGSSPLRLEVSDEAGIAGPLSDLLVWARFVGRDGRSMVKAEFLTADGTAVLDEIPASGARLDIRNEAGRVFGSARCGDPAREPVKRISLSDEHYDIVVVDVEGRPVHGVAVSLASETDRGWTVSGETDEHGRCTLWTSEPTNTVAYMRHPLLGRGYPLDMALARRVGDAFELVFDPSASIRMLVTDHGVPQ